MLCIISGVAILLHNVSTDELRESIWECMYGMCTILHSSGSHSDWMQFQHCVDSSKIVKGNEPVHDRTESENELFDLHLLRELRKQFKYYNKFIDCDPRTPLPNITDYVDDIDRPVALGKLCQYQTHPD